MYADDLVILSESEKGLQTALNWLNKYCTTWRLKKRTKVGWLSLVSFLKEKLNWFPVAYNRNDTIMHIPTYEIGKYLINIYKTHFVSCLTEDNKLALYAQVKKFGLEKYLNLITTCSLILGKSRLSLKCEYQHIVCP